MEKNKTKVYKQMGIGRFMETLKRDFISIRTKLEKQYPGHSFIMDVKEKDDEIEFEIVVLNDNTHTGKVSIERKIVNRMSYQPFIDVLLDDVYHGFIDMMDGLYAGRTKEERLKIMHDTKIGSIGVVSVIILLLMKFSLLYSINSLSIWQALLITPAWSRWGMVLMCCLFPYAKEEGKGKIFVEGARKWYILPQGIVVLIFSLLLLGWQTFYVLILLTLFVYLFGLLLKSKIGGITGDTIGAVNEICEVLPLLCISLIQSIQT